MVNVNCIVDSWQYRLLQAFRCRSHKCVRDANDIAAPRMTSQLLPKRAIIWYILFKHVLRTKRWPMVRVNNWWQPRISCCPGKELHTQESCMIMNNIKFAILFNCIEGKLNVSTDNRKRFVHRFMNMVKLLGFIK
ncbi:hypothetical protein D3C85_1158430 [compost metagenome]